MREILRDTSITYRPQWIVICNRANVYVHTRYGCTHDLQPRSPGAFVRKRYNSRRMTIIQVGVDYETFIEASFCPSPPPQRIDRWKGEEREPSFCARMRRRSIRVRGGCWHWQICSWIKALCRTKRRHNAPRVIVYATSYTSADATLCWDVITRSIPPLRFQAHSRDMSVSDVVGEEKERRISVRSLSRHPSPASRFKARRSFELEPSWFRECLAVSNISVAPNMHSPVPGY